ncbi:MAG: pseudouridine-5'-phosphate glycosidase, partial [Candidatus Marinimicrobia bacterium]|nr:pseudouridine-5'-phosphate glycosidase [Candidatus Neomarinimicrobiota bacterium]
MSSLFKLTPEVASALKTGRPVLALESTIISHGMPYPQNMEFALAAEQMVRDKEVVPATVAIHTGKACIGLSEN